MHMKKIYLLAILTFTLRVISSAQTTHTVTTSGFTYTPATVQANVGDQVIFNVDFSMHPTVEVSAATWAANQPTPLAGGFSGTSGSTMTVTMTAVGTRYYVCQMHVSSFGMKGKIDVVAANGIKNVPSVVALPYPNPASQQLYLSPAAAGDFSYTITDMLGRTVLLGSEYAQGMVTVDVSGIADGAYILSMTSANGLSSRNKIDIRH